MDLDVIRNKRMMVEAELEHYLNNPQEFGSEIFATRGRLLRLLNVEYVMESNLTSKENIKKQIDYHSKCQREQQRKMNLGSSKNNSSSDPAIRILDEIGYRFGKIAANVKNIKAAGSTKEVVTNVFAAGKNAVAMVGNILKEPIRALNSQSPSLADRLLVQPLEVPKRFFSNIIKPNSKYNGKVVSHMNVFLHNQLSRLLGLANKAVNDAIRKK